MLCDTIRPVCMRYERDETTECKRLKAEPLTGPGEFFLQRFDHTKRLVDTGNKNKDRGPKLTADNLTQ